MIKPAEVDDEINVLCGAISEALNCIFERDMKFTVQVRADMGDEMRDLCFGNMPPHDIIDTFNRITRVLSEKEPKKH